MVKSSTPAARPEATKSSKARPPTPLAWNATQLNPVSSSCAIARVKAGVVLPFIEIAIVGLRSSASPWLANDRAAPTM